MTLQIMRGQSHQLCSVTGASLLPNGCQQAYTSLQSRAGNQMAMNQLAPRRVTTGEVCPLVTGELLSMSVPQVQETGNQTVSKTPQNPFTEHYSMNV